MICNESIDWSKDWYRTKITCIVTLLWSDALNVSFFSQVLACYKTDRFSKAPEWAYHHYRGPVINTDAGLCSVALQVYRLYSIFWVRVRSQQESVNSLLLSWFIILHPSPMEGWRIAARLGSAAWSMLSRLVHTWMNQWLNGRVKKKVITGYSNTVGQILHQIFKFIIYSYTYMCAPCWSWLSLLFCTLACNTLFTVINKTQLKMSLFCKRSSIIVAILDTCESPRMMVNQTDGYTGHFLSDAVLTTTWKHIYTIYMIYSCVGCRLTTYVNE